MHEETVNTYSGRTAYSSAHYNKVFTNSNAESITCRFVVLWKIIVFPPLWFLKENMLFGSIVRTRRLAARVTDKPGLLFLCSQNWSFEMWYPE